MDKDRTRGERRARTERHARRVRRTEHFVRHGQRRQTCDCATALGRFRDATAFQCRCRGKRPGAPKVAGSLHKSEYSYRTTVRRRIWNRRLARAWLATIGVADAADAQLPAGPIIGRRSTRTW